MPKKELYSLAFLLLFSLSSNAKDIDEYISTSSGKVMGYIKNKVINYDDIPYAQPPVGDLRWKAPREILNTKALIQNKDNNFCIQEPSSMGGAPGEGVLTGTEDCSFIIEIFVLFCMPIPEPIGAPNGMIAQAPTSSSFFVIIGSSVQ